MNPDIKYKLQEDQYVVEGGYHRERLLQQNALGIESRGKLMLTADVIQRFNPRVVLDLGCGEGVLMEELSARGVSSVGIDLSEKATSLMPSSLRKNTIVGDIARLPIESGTVPMATMIAVLEHIPPDTIFQVIQEIHRTLEKDGIFVVRVPSRHQPIRDKHFQHFTPDSLKQTLEQSGLFTVEEMIGNHNTAIDWEELYETIKNGSTNDSMLPSEINERAERVYNVELKVCDPLNAKRLLSVCRKN
ncbi:hypothetical protein A3A93_03295 [Candidatus Roizmanbacteria bacterium RIFCSPLOWO2_01_FULL_38_12]|uniref:Methyltransferase type 11 domain-containing protein n=1 Tax=Candidatus Roizmanbacteria bacterium RIFCSPLOWO2_01_FULL_38_12 TaxID=1802061 RepID=A0A1F7ISN3_9BACT|nr:MAG: hypothetical protein A2861_03960 [Candidatus Roizmanbacteria bacterium RIFCSPHIGHO2_01_FULL_38_15]OGK35799.1 MAG: hypothetical protein A3F59_03585 [Candidatus Roizmanbacteria bacterium RIFCSPHIGHO2_12_FULL_38_13]OGK46372.1 MAG: hypothetical protein A3A93_03295 [Candidatus Roizmanbacteria bacterium RIFCSPLOWO2_01_FULL_38_12]